MDSASNLMASHTDYYIRPAEQADIPILVRFILAEAEEAEGRQLDPAQITRGVRAAVLEGAVTGYWVLVAHQSERLVGCISVGSEWSDWHAAPYWWVQSIYLLPELRGQGLAEDLLAYVEAQARVAGAVELRLYAHRENCRALRAYHEAGFMDLPYVIMGKILGEATTKGAE